MISDLNSVVLLIAFVGSGLLSGRCLWRTLFRRSTNWWLDDTVCLAGLLSAIALSFELADFTRDNLSGLLRLGANFGILTGLICVAMLIFGSLLRNPAASSWRSATMLGVIAMGLCAGTLALLSNRVKNYEFFGFGDQLPGVIQDESRFHGVTDKGRHVPLFRFSKDEERFAEFLSTSDRRLLDYRTSLIFRNDIECTANCHGWVFTGGLHLIRGEGVQRILEDNGYEVTNDPVAGDIIVYRDAYGVILHTGLVQGVLKDGSVMIESKWGIEQRFLHLPENQPYSKIYDFYRTSRGTHLIDVVEAIANDPYEG